MRRPLSALAICASTLVLMAARCGGDEDDGVHIGAYPKVDGEESGAGAAAPPDADPSVKSSADADADAILDTNPDGKVDAAPPKADESSTAKGAAAGTADPTRPKAGDEPGEPADDLFADPLDGANAGGGSDPKVDRDTMLDDQSTFEPGGSGLPSAVGPDGDSLPQVPGPDADMPDLGGPGMGSDLTE